ncbi:MAG TPA: hypothetical protein VMP01_10935 [Pirellulaceae bacterium]|nr:hypothetical protein [Pirellulaceae bacterium]
MLITERSGHSAKVDIRLHVAGLNLDVAQISRQFLILREPCEVAPGSRGQVIVTIDGREQIYPVVFHEGITPHSPRVNFC